MLFRSPSSATSATTGTEAGEMDWVAIERGRIDRVGVDEIAADWLGIAWSSTVAVPSPAAAADVCFAEAGRPEERLVDDAREGADSERDPRAATATRSATPTKPRPRRPCRTQFAPMVRFSS